MKTKDYGHLKLLIPEKEERREKRRDFASSSVVSVSPLYTVRINDEASAELTLEIKETINRGIKPVLMIYARKAGCDKKAYVCGRVLDNDETVTRELIEDTVNQLITGDEIFWIRYNEEFA